MGDGRRGSFGLVAGCVALTALAAAGALSLRGDDVAPRAAAGGALVWSDEFGGRAGTAPDPRKWTYNTGGGGWGNAELEYYTDSTANAALDGAGNLVITARRAGYGERSCHYGSCLYTSARLLTAGRFSQTYGRFEARMKVPAGSGLWPAFWMLGDDTRSSASPRGGEIDVMENVGSEPGTVHGSLHGPGYSGEQGLTTAFQLPGGALADAFHVFAVDWTPEAITWFVDGTAYGRRTRADTGGREWVFDHPFFLIVNLAVGGTWPGDPPPDAPFPQSMLVDYVRAYAATVRPHS